MRENDYLKLLNDLIDTQTIIPDENCQVISGVLSDALFSLVCGKALNSQSMIDQGYKLIDYHVETAEKYVLNYKWAHGITGLAWLLSLLSNKSLVDKNILNEIGKIDDYIGRSLKHDFDLKSYDFAVGALGKAHYFLERNTKKSKKYICEIIDFLDQSAIRPNDNECFWIDYYTGDNQNDLLVNFGMFHGHASIVYFLSKFYKEGICKNKSKRLLINTLNFLERIYQANNKNIPNKLLFNDKKFEKYETINIQGWCHGLLSNSLSFYFAGKVLKETRWIKIFKKLVAEASDFKCEKINYQNGTEPSIQFSNNKGRTDISFCHGLIGNIFMYNKLNKIFNDQKYLRTSEYLEEILLDIIIENKNLNTKFFFYKGVTSGVSGLGLLLLQKLQKDTSLMDKLFLLDLEYF